MDYKALAAKSGGRIVSSQQSPTKTEGSKWSELPGNIAPSAGRFVGDIVGAVTHPIQTGKSIGGLAVGLAQKAIPGEQEQEKYADAAGQFFKNRYGSLDKLKETIINDPVGFASDLATVFTAGGAAVSKVGTASKVGSLTKAGQTISKVGSAIEPLSAVTKLGGNVLTRATKGKTLAPFAKSVDTEVLDVAKKLDVELPASAVSKSNAVKALETIGGRGLFGQKINNVIEKAVTKMDDIANNAVAKIAADENLSSVGTKILTSLESYKDNYFKARNALFEQAKIPLITKMDASNSLAVLDDLITSESRAAKVIGSPSPELIFYRKLRTGLAKGTLTANEFNDTINKLNKKVNNFNDAISTGDQASLKKLISTMDEDFTTSLERVNPDLAQRIKVANEFYKEGLNKIDGAKGDVILANKNRPDKILPLIINKGTSIEDIPRILEIVGPENAKSIQAYVMKDMFDMAKSKANGSFTASGLTTAKSKYGTKLTKILTPDQLNTINDLEKLSKAIARGQSLAAGSQTAFTIRTMMEVSTVIGGNWLLAMQMFLGDLAFSKFIASKAGQKLLSTGIEMTGKTGQNISSFGNKASAPSQALFQSGRMNNISN